MRSKKYIVYAVVMLVMMVSIGVSYSYFSINNSINKKEINISSKSIRIIFTDKMEISDNSITPGWRTQKSFSVENKSNDVFNYNIIIKNLINTFETEGYLQYKITSDTGYNMTEYKDVPKSSEAKDVTLVYDIDIEKGSKHEYTIEFIYRDSEDVDQSIDMGKVFSGILAIVEGSIDPSVFYSVTLEIENGEVKDDNPKETNKNGSVTFDIEIQEGYNIGNITCDNNASGEVKENKVVISNIKSNGTCKVETSKKTYTWEMKITNGKTDALNRIVEYGSDAVFNITPTTGYTLEGAILSEGCILEGNTVTVSDVRSNGICTVTLPKAKYTVSLGGNNVAVTDTPKEVEYEGSTTFNVNPNTGYNLTNASVNCDNGASASLSGTTVSVSNITANTTCMITPNQNTYELILTVVNGSGESKKTVTHGGSAAYTITANTGYTLSNPTISCTGSASGSINGNTVTISGVTTSQTCTVTLKKQTYTVNIGSNNTGMGTVSPGSQVIEYGNSASVTVNPATGYHYVSNNCGGTLNGNIMTIPNITTNVVCTVYFEVNTYTLTVYTNDANMGTVSPASITVNHGSNATFTISSNPGYRFASTDCGVPLINNQLTWTNVTWNGACTVYFEPATYTVTLTASNAYFRPWDYQGCGSTSMCPLSRTLTYSVGYGGTVTFPVEFESTNRYAQIATIEGCSGVDMSLHIPSDLSQKYIMVSNVNNNLNCTITLNYSPSSVITPID